MSLFTAIALFFDCCCRLSELHPKEKKVYLLLLGILQAGAQTYMKLPDLIHSLIAIDAKIAIPAGGRSMRTVARPLIYFTGTV
jgi:hypothetical protein